MKTILNWKMHQKIPVFRIIVWSFGDWRCKNSPWATQITDAPIPSKIEAVYMKAFKEFKSLDFSLGVKDCSVQAGPWMLGSNP